VGELEKKYKERRRRADLQELVLSTVSAAGIIAVGLVAPNVLGALKKLGMLPTARQKDSIRAARVRLIKNGLLRWEGKKLRLTEAGEKKLRYLRLQDYKMPLPKKWDERWRVLIFDIPEKRKGLREKIRNTLVVVGFVRLQDSVWIYPYDCEDLITLLKADFKVGKDMLYMIIDTLEYDAPIRKKFGLQ
jgi:DNA-binding transcriptional regulator PaaX